MANEWSYTMPCGAVVELLGTMAEDNLRHYLEMDARTELLAAKVQEHKRTCEACKKKTSKVTSEPEPPYRPCVGCGYCCRKAQCTPSIRVYGIIPAGCPALYFKDGRYWCQLADEEKKLPEDQRWASKYVAIGAGCCSPLNSDRVKVMKGGF